MNSKIKLPILKSLEVENYPMYPGSGKEKKGFKHTFQSGVNVIVGVNGLGKTTLLNILFRMLVGPFDPRKSEVLEPGAKTHALVWWRSAAYFADRVATDAREARVTVDIAFGKHNVRLVRTLGPNLQIESLKHNNKVLEDADEDRYFGLISELSGIDSAYDWDFVVRNLLFFFEEKIPLIWNPKGQFEILRVLFLDTDISAKCATLHDEIMGEDSRVRNLGWHIDGVEKDIAAREAELQKASQEVESMAILQRHVSDLASEIKIITAAEQTLEGKVLSLEEEIFKGKIEIHDNGVKLEQSRGQYLRLAFPDIPEVSQVVLGHLFAGENCLVCGNPSDSGRERLARLLKAHQCPACESELRTMIGKIDPKHLVDARLRKLEEEQRAKEKAVDALEEQLGKNQKEFESTQQELNKKLAEKAQFDRKILRLVALSGADPVANTEEQILMTQKREFEAGRKKLETKRKKYDTLLEQARDRIANVAEQIVATFSKYAQAFILEGCKLSYSLDERYVGQGGLRIGFPSFKLEMTSPVLEIPRARHEREEVSESQKEFIDLAFRMALLRAANPKSGALLVIETPEASLDSVFVGRAGKMLHDFGQGTAAARNQIIATSNLNRENMIPALLGLEAGHNRSKAMQARTRSQVLNLLELAAPSRAYLEFKKQYDATFKEALGY